MGCPKVEGERKSKSLELSLLNQLVERSCFKIHVILQLLTNFHIVHCGNTDFCLFVHIFLTLLANLQLMEFVYVHIMLSNFLSISLKVVLVVV